METKTNQRRFSLSRVAVVLVAILLFFALLSYFLSTRQVPEEAVTQFVETSVVATETPGAGWLVYTNTTPYYTFSYPPFWIRAGSIPAGIENCGGPAFFTQTTKSWMTVCSLDVPEGMSVLKATWEAKTEVRDLFIGGHLGMAFEYKQLNDRYEYYTVVENTSEFDLLQFHLSIISSSRFQTQFNQNRSNTLIFSNRFNQIYIRPSPFSHKITIS